MAHRKKLVGPPFLQQAGGAGQGVALKDVDALAEHVEAGQGVGGLVCVELELLVVEPAEVAEALVAPVAAVGEGVGVDALAGHPGKVLGGLHARAEVDALGLEVGMPPGFVGQLEADALERLGLVGLAHAGAVVPAVHVEEGAGVEAVVAVLGGVSAREAQGRHQAVVGRGLDVFGVDGGALDEEVGEGCWVGGARLDRDTRMGGLDGKPQGVEQGKDGAEVVGVGQVDVQGPDADQIDICWVRDLNGESRARNGGDR